MPIIEAINKITRHIRKTPLIPNTIHMNHLMKFNRIHKQKNLKKITKTRENLNTNTEYSYEIKHDSDLDSA